MATKRNREQWLTDLAKAVGPMFKEQGHDLSETKFRVSVGFPSTRALSNKQRRIGECWHSAASAAGVREIFISPVLDDPMQVAGVLVHELAHAVLPEGVGHGAPFARLARALGLEGKPTATTEGPEFKAQLAPILKKLGEYPHKRISGSSGRKKQTTRLLKVECELCGYTARVTRKWIEEVGAPLCPCSHEEMTVAL